MSSSDFFKDENNWKLGQYYYQNQNDADKYPGNEKFYNKKKQNEFQNRGPSNIYIPSINVPSSLSVSSQKSLLSNGRKKINACNSLLIIAIFIQITSLISIVVTFIFPFWLVFEIDIPSSVANQTNGFINVTNIENSISLSTVNTQTDDLLVQINNKIGQIKFDLGLWEVKTHRGLQFTDPISHVSYQNIISMLWLNADVPSQSFLALFMNFIKLYFSNIFIVQVIEILHVIFTFLSFCFTSLTLCLCSKHKTSLCWFLVCYFVTLVSFATGLTVIILIITWQMIPISTLVSSQTNSLSVTKAFNWCFWASVGINASILFASFLILSFILFSSIRFYKQKKKYFRETMRAKLNSVDETTSQVQKAFSSNIDIEYSQNNARIPRLQTNINNVPIFSSNLKISSLSLGEPRVPSAPLSEYPIQSSNTQSYVFYTGHGNYRKHDLSVKSESRDEYEPSNDFLSTPKATYSVLEPYQSNQLNSNDHPYSNVLENPSHNAEFLYSNHRL